MRLASATTVPVLDAEGFGLVAGGDTDGGVGHHGDDAHRAAAQLGARLLLHRGEVGVEVDEEPVQLGTAGRKGVNRQAGAGDARIRNRRLNPQGQSLRFRSLPANRRGGSWSPNWDQLSYRDYFRFLFP